MRRGLVDVLGLASVQDPLQALVAAGVLDEAAARRARNVAKQAGESHVAVVHQLALADDGAVADILARAYDIPRAGLEDVPDDAPPITGLSRAFMRAKRVLPLSLDAEGVTVGIVDPTAPDGPGAVGFASRLPVRLRIMAFDEWSKGFDHLYGPEAASPDDASDQSRQGSVWADDAALVRDQSEAAPAVRLVESLIVKALERGASDVHIEPLADRLRVRFRLDGELKVVAEEPAHLAEPVAARIKVLANMDVADRRRAQDGRTSLAAKGRPVDIRISTVPSTYGETVALRLLRRDPGLLDLATLGFSEPMVDLLQQVLFLRRGLFLVSGPTGSGKTTTLYAMLQQLRGEALKILSIEDPIEYFFPDITQVQVNEEAGVTFATALRSFLRQDPDVILVGEIRDAETARIAIQAALTGHLVLATLHTSDAPGVVSRLVDMGVDRYLVGATLTAVVSQRLTRRLCATCRRPRTPSAPEVAALAQHGGYQAEVVYDAVGCPACRGSGYRGRLAIGEGFRVDESLRPTIPDPSGAVLAAALSEAGYRPLLMEASKLVAEGQLSATELWGLMFA